MRHNFAEMLHSEMASNSKIILITGDLGYGLWDKIRLDYSDRFYNAMSSEQLMVGMATGFAMEGYIPIVYSITPFAIYRPFELIRNYLDHERIPVKIIGGGRDKDYGHLGFSHWGTDDIDILSAFKNIKLYKPKILNHKIFKEIIENKLPCYMNLKR
jgi:transketolase